MMKEESKARPGRQWIKLKVRRISAMKQKNIKKVKKKRGP